MSPTALPPGEPIGLGNLGPLTPDQLPDDRDTLKGMIVELVTTLQQERRDKEALRHRVALLLARLYGPRTERVNPDQKLLFADWLAAQGSDAGGDAANPPPLVPDPSAAPTGTRRRCKPHGRRQLPDNLPRRPLDHELTHAERVCSCGQTRLDIGTDVSEQLDWQPASYFVWQHRVHKYLCPHCSKQAAEVPMTSADATPADTSPRNTPAADTATPSPTPAADTAMPLPTPAATTNATARIGPAIVSAPKPAAPIAKGLPGPGLLAHIIVSKYFDHLPLHRQEPISARQGLFLSRSTLCDWMAACAALLRPLYARMVSAVLQSSWLHTDDTSVKNQGHQPGTTALSRLWIYWGDRAHPYNVFDFTINRKRDGPQQFLADFHGYLHADAFSGYDALYLPSPRAGTAPILEVACNAHARRKFHEARGSDLVRSHQALAYYRQLYELERAATSNDFDDAQRLRMRQDLAVPILNKFKTWLDEQRPQVLPKSPMAEALNYALNNWIALIRYTEAGFLSIDNNVAEREMKRIAIGRKNWLFVGSDNGGRTAAVLYSFTSTCQRLGIEPWAYLQDVLARLPNQPADRLADLLPDRWQAARAQATSGGAAPTPDASSLGNSIP